MKTVYSDEHRRHHAAAELTFGKMVPAFEQPRRAFAVLEEVRAAGLGPILPPQPFDLAAVLRVHDERFVEFLQNAWQEWVRERGEYDALPLSWMARGMRSVEPATIDGRLSYFSFDAGTPITAGTWTAVRAAAAVVLTAQRIVAGGERAAFALSRPPGHHAGSDFYGGYCYLNFSAIAAQAFVDAGAERVAVLDVDYHHGNGTQQIFYQREDVLTISLHADPRYTFPFFLGHADEIGGGYNLNLPLPHGTDWAGYRGALACAARKIELFGPAALVVPLGADTYKEDPISHFRFEQQDYLRLGAEIARLGVPTLFVLEGGYAIDALGENVVNVLKGFEET